MWGKSNSKRNDNKIRRQIYCTYIFTNIRILKTIGITIIGFIIKEFPRIPFEIYYEVFLELDEPDLFNLGSVSRYYNILTADNGVWSQLALKRWEAKEGMREISEEYRNFWFKSPGAWKRVYCLIEKEARRTSLDVNDLVDNIWYCAPVDNIDDWNNNKLVTFSEDGTYTHHHEPFNPTFTWTMKNGSLSLNYKPFRLMRSSGWDLVMSNGALVFKSPGTKSFRRKLREDGLIPNDNNF